MLLTVEQGKLISKYSNDINCPYEDNWYAHLKDLTDIKKKDLDFLRDFDFAVMLEYNHHAFDNFELLYQPKDLKKIDKETAASYKEMDNLLFQKLGQHVFHNYEMLNI